MNHSKKYKVGYTQGVYDMFHIGHLNLLRNAKEQCDCLIVGVNSDGLVREYKHKETVVNETDRREIIQAVRYVDKGEIVDSLDKLEQWKRFKFDAIFIGSDWKGDARWRETEEILKPYGVDVIYLEYTKGVCSSGLRGKESVKEG